MVADQLAYGISLLVDDVFADEVRRGMARLDRQHQLAGRQKPSRTHVGPAIELIRAVGAPEPPPRLAPAPVPDPPPTEDTATRPGWESEPEPAPAGSGA